MSERREKLHRMRLVVHCRLMNLETKKSIQVAISTVLTELA